MGRSGWIAGIALAIIMIMASVAYLGLMSPPPGAPPFPPPRPAPAPDEPDRAVLPYINEFTKMSKLREELEALPKGNIFLHAPKVMKVDEKRKVEANVGINVPMEILRKQAPSGDQTFEGSPRVSAEMIATLNGPGFKIEAITPEQQTIAEGFPTVWSWNIEAKEHGDQELEATLYALVPSGGDKAARQRVDSYTQKISVTVREQTWGEWVEAFSHEIDAAKAIAVTIGGIATAALGWLGISLNRRKQKVSTASTRRRKRTTNHPRPTLSNDH
jgi:hypothetical protein